MSRRGDRDEDYEPREERFQRGPPPPHPSTLPKAPVRERVEEDVFIRRVGPGSDRDRSRKEDLGPRRAGGGRQVDEESYVRRGPPGPPPPRGHFEEIDSRPPRRGPPERREIIEERVNHSRGPPGPDRGRPFPPPPPPEFQRGPPRAPVRERSPSETSDRGGGPAFLRDDYERQELNSSLVVRRERPVSPVRYTERLVRRRSWSHSRSPPPVLRKKVIETKEFRRRSPSPPPTPQPPRRVIERWTERRPPSPPPLESIRYREREEFRDRESSVSSPEPSTRSLSPPAPNSPPPPNFAPPIHQEIITHHRHIDHGFERAPSSPPPPPAPKPKEKERTSTTEIDIHHNRNNLEVEIKKGQPRAPSRAPSKAVLKAPAKVPSRAPSPTESSRSRNDWYEDDRVRITEDRMEVRRRRSTSAKPRRDFSLDIRETTRETGGAKIRDDESESGYYSRKADERAYIGEAYRGATKDWAIVDVPPGTERVVLDGVGGASQEITWQRYNGVRRSKFIPERLEAPSPPPPSPPPVRPKSTGMELEIRTHTREGGEGVYEREYERIEESGDRRVGFPLPRTPPKQKAKDLWTEITKDLVVREAIEELGYDYDETPEFFYVISYLKYEDVQELVELSDFIRRKRQQRLDDIANERKRIKRAEEEWKAREKRHHHSSRDSGYDDERIFEREVVYERGGPPPKRRGGR